MRDGNVVGAEGKEKKGRKRNGFSFLPSQPPPAPRPCEANFMAAKAFRGRETRERERSLSLSLSLSVSTVERMMKNNQEKGVLMDGRGDNASTHLKKWVVRPTLNIRHNHPTSFVFVPCFLPPSKQANTCLLVLCRVSVSLPLLRGNFNGRREEDNGRPVRRRRRRRHRQRALRRVAHLCQNFFIAAAIAPFALCPLPSRSLTFGT